MELLLLLRHWRSVGAVFGAGLCILWVDAFRCSSAGDESLFYEGDT